MLVSSSPNLGKDSRVGIILKFEILLLCIDSPLSGRSVEGRNIGSTLTMELAPKRQQ